MTCRELIEFLDRYVGGELAHASRLEFDRHLDACRACRDYLRTYRDTIALAKASCAEEDGAPAEMPEDLVKAILDSARPRG
jgi:anti-sigma factor RsiW